jgi:hypothetical protein
MKIKNNKLKEEVGAEAPNMTKEECNCYELSQMKELNTSRPKRSEICNQWQSITNKDRINLGAWSADKSLMFGRTSPNPSEHYLLVVNINKIFSLGDRSPRMKYIKKRKMLLNHNAGYDSTRMESAFNIRYKFPFI